LRTSIERIRDKYPARPNRLVVIGHSFGGLITYYALSNIFIERFMSSIHSQAKNGEEKLNNPTLIKGFGDLVVLINPAIEAMRFFSIYDMTQEYINTNINKNQKLQIQLPKLVILSSEADFENKRLFPIGRYLSLFMLNKFYDKIKRKYSEIDEEKAELQVIGQFENYIGYSLKIDDSFPIKEKNDEYEIINKLKRQWFDSKESIFNFPETKLTIEKGNRLIPYLIIKTTKDIIPGHSMPIFSDKIEKNKAIKLLQFIRYLILLSEPEDIKAKEKSKEFINSLISGKSIKEIMDILKISQNISPLHYKEYDLDKIREKKYPDMADVYNHVLNNPSYNLEDNLKEQINNLVTKQALLAKEN